MLLRARSGQASGPLTQALRWGWRGHFGGPQGPVQRLGCLEKGCLLHGALRCKWWTGRRSGQGHDSGKEVSAGGPPQFRGWYGWGPHFLPVCPVQENAAPAEQCPGSLGPGCALRGSSVGTEPEEAWGAGCLPRMIPCASSVSPRPPRQTHFLQGSAIA